MTTITPEQAAAMDDMGAHSQRVSEADLDRLIADKHMHCQRCNLSLALGDCDCMASEWSAPRRLHDWTEVLPETCETKPRLGQLSSMERRLLSRRPMYTWAGVVLFAVFAALVRGCA